MHPESSILGQEDSVKGRAALIKFGIAVVAVAGLSSQPTAYSQEVTQQASARRVKNKVDPRYPDIARMYQLKGNVKIEVTIGSDGTVKKARVVGGNPLLAGAAMDAIKQWRYEPAAKESVEVTDFYFEGPTR
jgi:TonB family protein